MEAGKEPALRSAGAVKSRASRDVGPGSKREYESMSVV